MPHESNPPSTVRLHMKPSGGADYNLSLTSEAVHGKWEDSIFATSNTHILLTQVDGVILGWRMSRRILRWAAVTLFATGALHLAEVNPTWPKYGMIAFFVLMVAFLASRRLLLEIRASSVSVGGEPRNLQEAEAFVAQLLTAAHAARFDPAKLQP